MLHDSRSIKKCRFCGSLLPEPYLDLNFTPLADRFLSRKQLDEPEVYYPLRVCMCSRCGLHQLDFSVDPAVLYQNRYPYESSLTKTGSRHYEEFARSVAEEFHLTPRDLVVDIGSNAGVLLRGFQKMGARTLGIDPAKDIASRASQKGIITIPDFFSRKVARSVRRNYGAAKIVVATNVFAHVYDHTEFMEALRLIMQKDSVFIFESPHLATLFKNYEYDTIYHEHLLYLSLKPAIRFVEQFGMEVFAAETHSIHGGSFRVYCGEKRMHPIQKNVSALVRVENEQKLYSREKLTAFADTVYQNRDKLYSLLLRLKRKGKRIAAVSAPAKGMTLLSYCRIGNEIIDFVTEKSKLKIGCYTPGTHIPIFPDSELIKRKPDYALLLAWNFSEEIMKNLAAYKQGGGRFIIPIPRPRIL